jgi:hypothetical protein
MSAHDRPASGREPRMLRAAALALASFTLLGFAPSGCGDGTYPVNNDCPKLAAATGGDPLGTWKVQSSCQVPYARTAADDWCQKLVYGANGVTDGLFLGTDILPIVGTSAVDGTTMSEIIYSRDLTMMCGQNCGFYQATLVFEGTSTTNFPLGCLRQHIPNPTCADLGAKIQTLVNVLPTIRNVQCTQGVNGDSCDCTYLVTTATIAPDLGAWRVKDNLLIHYPQTLALAGLTDFAVVGNELQLHGHDGEPLLAHDPLRNLTLTKE